MVYRLTHPARRARENSRQVVSRQCFAWTYSGSATFTRFWLRIVWHVGVWNPILQKNVDVSKQTCLVHESVTWYRKLWEMSCQVSRNVSRHCPATVPPLSRHCPATVPPLSRHCPATVPPLSRHCPATVPPHLGWRWLFSPLASTIEAISKNLWVIIGFLGGWGLTCTKNTSLTTEFLEIKSYIS
jgi:hypothetical protein